MSSKEYNSKYNEMRRKYRYLGVNCPQRAVMVVDPMCADPYYISRNEYEWHKNEYMAMDGIKIFFNEAK